MPDSLTAPQPEPKTDRRTLRDLLDGPIEVGAPDVAGPLAVFPLFGPEPTLAYTSFSRAHGAGQAEITELESGASVNDLTVINRAPSPVLLYEGEELLGAQQNRVLDISLLLAAGAKTRIPVSCVEQGRWDGRRRHEAFRPSAQAADPELRKLKARRVRERVAAGADPRADQGEVWSQVAGRMHEMDAPSPTAAMSDLYEHRRDSLDELRKPIALHEGQIGAVCAIGGRISILDLVSRPDVWADLHPALVQGYALDALRWRNTYRGPSAAGRERIEIRVPRRRWIHEFIGRVTATPSGPTHRSQDAGLGETIRFAHLGVAGSALVAETPGDADELIQLCAHPDEEDGQRWSDAGGRGTRVRRPSQRRR
jgi:hypothetical protein